MSKIVFQINPKNHEVSEFLELEVKGLLDERKRFQPFSKKKRLFASELLTVTRNNDLINGLIQEEMHYLRSKGIFDSLDTHSFQYVHFHRKKSLTYLSELFLKECLFFNGEILTDFHTKPARVICEMTALSQDNFSCSFNLDLNGDKTTISACDYVERGNPHCFIKEGQFYPFPQGLSWNLLQSLFEKDTLSLSERQKDKLLDLLEETDVDIQESSPQVLKEIFPILQLKDIRGAFADLLFDYQDEGIIAEHVNDKPAIRNRTQESSWEKDLLEAGYMKKNVGSSHYYCPLDQVFTCLELLVEIGWEVRDLNNRKLVYQHKTDISINNENEALIIKGSLHYSTAQISIKQLLEAHSKTEYLCPLDTGHVALLPMPWIEKHLSAVNEFVIEDQEDIRVPFTHLGVLDSLVENYSQDALRDLFTGLKDMSSLITKEPGSGFSGELRHYQQEGVDWLHFLYQHHLHGILADDMGLGKTVEVLAFLSTLDWTLPILIVLPTSLIFNWKKEIQTFLPNCHPYLHHGPDRLRSVDAMIDKTCILTSYHLLRIDQELLSQIQYQCVILDEAQMIKNSNTDLAKSVYTLKSRFRLSLTGTPIENHIKELYSQFHFLFPGLLTKKHLNNPSVEQLHIIKKKTAPFILRRSKKSVALDLPDKVEQTVWVSMDTEQEDLYLKTFKRYQEQLLCKGGLKKNAANKGKVFEALLRLRQICCHPLLIEQSKPAITNSCKFEALFNDLETLVDEGSKVLVYSQFTQMLQLMRKEVENYGWAYTYLDGQTKDRESQVTRFQNDPKVQIFLISLKAGGIGLNLTQADSVLIYDPWWNAAWENQAIDRAHRIGRTKTVVAKRYICSNTIEEKIMELKSRKTSLADHLIQVDSKNIAISFEDLISLLEEV